jgi:hypothetical protein
MKLSGPARRGHAPFALSIVNRDCVAVSYGRAGRSVAQNGGFPVRASMAMTSSIGLVGGCAGLVGQWQDAVAAREALPECYGDAFSSVTKVRSREERTLLYSAHTTPHTTLHLNKKRETLRQIKLPSAAAPRSAPGRALFQSNRFARW